MGWEERYLHPTGRVFEKLSKQMLTLTLAILEGHCLILMAIPSASTLPHSPAKVDDLPFYHI